MSFTILSICRLDFPLAMGSPFMKNGFVVVYTTTKGQFPGKKSSCSFGFCQNYLDPPPPNLDNLYDFF